MNPCDSIHVDLDAFRDGVLDEKRRIEIQQHLKDCATCNSEMKQSTAIEQVIKNAAASWTPPGNLWSRIQTSASEQQSTLANAAQFNLSKFGWVVAALLLLTLSLFNVNMVRNDVNDLTDSVASVLVNEFHTFVISRRKLDYADNKPAAIRQWFGNKVDFRAPEPVVTKSMQLTGGRLCNMLNQRIASYMYQSDGAWVSLYIMKPEPAGIANNSSAETVVQGYGYIGWEHDGLHYSLIGDIDVNRLRQFANELKAV